MVNLFHLYSLFRSFWILVKDILFVQTISRKEACLAVVHLALFSKELADFMGVIHTKTWL